MANTFSTNVTPATCAVAVYNLKTLLKAAGWTVTKSSDGSVYNAAGDEISSGASGAGGMDNAKAWFVIQEPAAPSRQFCFQRQNTTGVNTSYSWRVKYSKGAGFTGGTPGILQVPSAGDEQVLLGAGSDASPTMAALFGTVADGGFRHNLMVDDASPYCWASFGWVNTTGIPTHGLLFDKMISPTTVDVDPIIVYLNGVISASANGGVAGAGCFQYESILRNNAKLFGYSTGAAWSTLIFGMALMVSNAGTYKLCSPAGLNANEDAKDDLVGIKFIRFNTGTNLGDWKGYSTLLQWSSVARATGSTESVAAPGAKDRVVVCDVTLPWDGSAPTV